MALYHRDHGTARLVPVAATVLLALTGCVPPSSEPPTSRTPIRVSSDSQPYQMWDGMAARKAADAKCGPRGVRSTIYDRYDRSTGEWVYPGGCA
jgi:hypothetical protein